MKNKITLIIVLLAIVIALNPLFSQIQLGEDIDGEAVLDNSGNSVSLSSDGNRVAIGAKSNSGNGNSAGHVRIFEWNGVSWTQMGEDIDGESAGDWSGYSLSLASDGNQVAIGARLNGGNGFQSGHVRIFEWNGANWIQKGSDIDGESTGNWSGFSVSLSSDGNRVAIGAPTNSGNGSSAGHVRIFEWNGVSWVQVGGDIDGEEAGDLSGSSVSLSSDGNRVAIGAPSNNGNGFEAGQVRIFEWNGANWTQMGPDIDGEAADDLSGNAVSLSSEGNRVVIGAFSNSGNGFKRGHVRIFEWNGVSWVQVGEDIDGDSNVDLSGSSVSFTSDGNRVAIGAPSDGSQAGHVQIYEWIGGDWEKVGAYIEGEVTGDQFGSSVSLSSNGHRVAIGAPANNGNGFNSGHVRVFELAPVSTESHDINSKIKIHPNPTNGKMELTGFDNGTIRVFNTSGQLILHKEIHESAIDISELMSGIYFLQIITGNQMITKKIIRE